MPAPVPPGFTRGPILFLGPTSQQQVGHYAENQLLQRFIHEAGDYGARLAIVSSSASAAQQSYQQLLAAMEVDSVETVTVATRSDAMTDTYTAQLEQATGILLVAESALQLAGLIGGTPLAQTIRRANAQGKVVCGVGRSASILCQHTIAFENRQQFPRPFVHRHLIQFAPGLGIVNRLVLDVEQEADIDLHGGVARLLAAVAYNPFLVGVSIEADTGIAVYPDTTLEVFGMNNVLIVDGNSISHTDVHEQDLPERNQHRPSVLLNSTLHVLSHGYTFNFDTREAHLPSQDDIPTEGGPAHVTF